jgi:hypothetical protein
MRTLLLLFFLAIGTCAMAQKKLKMTIEKTSGDTIYSTSDVRIYVKPGGPRAVADYLKSSVYRIKTRYVLDFGIQTGRSNNVTIPASGTASIVLTNGNTVVLYSTGEHRSRVSSLDYGCYLFAFFRLTPADIKELKQSPVESISITSSGGNLDYVIKGKFADTISEQLEKITGGN